MAVSVVCPAFGMICRIYSLCHLLILKFDFLFLSFFSRFSSLFIRSKVIAAILSARASTATASASMVATAKSDQAISLAKHVDCERQCPYYYFPICATNGNPDENRMFVNICEMHAWNCDVEKSKWRAKHEKKQHREKNTCILQTYFPSANTTFRWFQSHWINVHMCAVIFFSLCASVCHFFLFCAFLPYRISSDEK